MLAAALASFGPHAQPRSTRPRWPPAPGPDDPPRAHSCPRAARRVLDHVRRGECAGRDGALRRRVRDAEFVEGDDQDLLPNLGIAAFHARRRRAAFRLHDMLLTRARATGALIMIVHALTRRVLVELATGGWTSLVTGASEAMPLAGSSGQPGLAALPLAELRWSPRSAATTARRRAGSRPLKRSPTAHPVGVTAPLVADSPGGPRPARATPQPATAFHHLEQIHDAAGAPARRAGPHRGRRARRAARPRPRVDRRAAASSPSGPAPRGRARPPSTAARCSRPTGRRRGSTSSRRWRTHAESPRAPAPGAHPARLRRVPAPRPPPGRRPRAPARGAGGVRGARCRAAGPTGPRRSCAPPGRPPADGTSPPPPS